MTPFKSDGAFNTAIGNFMADAVYNQANPVFKSRTGKDINLGKIDFYFDSDKNKVANGTSIIV